jgi:hypothetical protein
VLDGVEAALCFRGDIDVPCVEQLLVTEGCAEMVAFFSDRAQTGFVVLGGIKS